jgi:hypothetical protein
MHTCHGSQLPCAKTSMRRGEGRGEGKAYRREGGGERRRWRGEGRRRHRGDSRRGRCAAPPPCHPMPPPCRLAHRPASPPHLRELFGGSDPEVSRWG